MLKDTDAKLGSNGGPILPASLGDDDLELKKLFVRRHCAATGAREQAVVDSLVADNQNKGITCVGHKLITKSLALGLQSLDLWGNSFGVFFG